MSSVAIVGATGAVGREIMKILETRKFPLTNLKLLASRNSAGKEIRFKNQNVPVEEIGETSFKGVDIALFSASGDISKKYAPIAVSSGATVIDNSSAFRMNPDVPLVVPEINGEDIKFNNGIIANPNCSTIIMNLTIAPLYNKYGVERVVVSTYQAASGAGAAAMNELEQQCRDWCLGVPIIQEIFKRQYVWNLFSHNSPIDIDSGYNEEELKMVNETKKIFGDPDIGVAVTCIRVPVLRAHCESINVTLRQSYESIDEIRNLISDFPGLTVKDDREANEHPEPLMASGQDDCYVGRIRADVSQPEKGIEMFVAGDQIRKGAALNAVQIAELILVY